jgi:hypothetical protein
MRLAPDCRGNDRPGDSAANRAFPQERRPAAAECDRVLTARAPGKRARRPGRPGRRRIAGSGIREITVDLPLGWKVEDGGMQITRDEVRRLVEAGAQLVEVLPRDEFDDEHLPGATSLPLKSLTAGTSAVLDRSRPVIVYCWDGL